MIVFSEHSAVTTHLDYTLKIAIHYLTKVCEVVHFGTET